MSSHREAPEISKDPVADSTDVYAFVSPSNPDNVVLIANYVPLQTPDGGPNFYEFGDDVIYEIHVANSGKGTADISFQFRFETEIRNPKTFLYNIGPIGSHRRQELEPAAVLLGHDGQGRQEEEAGRASCPARRSTSARAARPTTPSSPPRPCTRSASARFFAGQRADAFHVDLGSIFDLGRPATAQRGAPDPAGEDGRHQLRAGLQRAQHRDRGADQGPDPERQEARQPPEQERRDRGLDDGQAPEVADLRRQDRSLHEHRSVGAGLAAGQPAGQRGADPDGGEGPAGTTRRPRTTRSTRAT